MDNMPIKKSNVSCIIPFNKKGELLLQKKTMDYKFVPGSWALFGGGIEEGETPEQAMKREINEELVGMDVNQFKFIKKEDYKEEGVSGIREGEIYLFGGLFKEDLSELSIKEGGGFALFKPEELKSLPLIPHLRDTIDRCLKILKI